MNKVFWTKSKSVLKQALMGSVLAVTLAACTSAQIIATQNTLASVAQQIDAGITTFAVVDLPLVCGALTTFVTYANESVSLGVVTATSDFAKDIAIAQALATGPGCATAGNPVTAGQLISNIIAEIAAIKADLNGGVTVTSAVVASAAHANTPAAKKALLVRLHAKDAGK